MKLRGPIRRALRPVGDGKFVNAITDAGKASQEALVQVGCVGKNLGPLISDARTKGVAWFARLEAGRIENVMKWVSAGRCQSGTGTTVLQPGFADLPGCPDRLGGVGTRRSWHLAKRGSCALVVIAPFM
jgi:hypothetical protein